MILCYEVEGGAYITAGESSGKIKKILKKLGVSPSIIRKVSVAMYEAEINMVIHANGGEIKTEITPEKIHIILKDDGPGIENIELAMTPGYSTASKEAREMGFGAGMGLVNMKKNTDFFQIHSEVGVGTTVELTVMLGQSCD